MKWEDTSRSVVLRALLWEHPGIREMLVQEDRFKDLADFSFIWEGTISALKRRRWIKEVPKARQTMFRGFRLTALGLAEAKKCAAHQRKER